VLGRGEKEGGQEKKNGKGRRKMQGIQRKERAASI
jgi:hypothetical protein